MKVYLLIITILYINGCATNKRLILKETSKNFTIKTINKISTNQEEIVKIIPSKKTYLPDWIMNINSKNGYICSIGSSVLNSNMAITKKVAIIQAKANISQEIKSYVDTKIQLQKSFKNDKYTREFSSETKITSTQMIKNIKIINHFIDTRQKIYYIELCSKI